jgi:hypothetical protein
MEGQAGRQTDRQTDMLKLLVAFCDFANVPEKMKKNLALVQQQNIHS